MQIVINVPEKLTCEGFERPFTEEEKNILIKAIGNGTPLPRGHKRLIEDNFDVGPVFDKEGYRTGYRYMTQEDLNNAPTIIEAESEET